MVIVGRQAAPFDPLAEADGDPAPTVGIPAGEFVMGSDTGAADEKPGQPSGARTNMDLAVIRGVVRKAVEAALTGS